MFTLVHRAASRTVYNSVCIIFAVNIRFNHSEGDGKVKEMYITCIRWGLKCTERSGRKVTSIHHLFFNLPKTIEKIAFSLSVY